MKFRKIEPFVDAIQIQKGMQKWTPPWLQDAINADVVCFSGLSMSAKEPVQAVVCGKHAFKTGGPGDWVVCDKTLPDTLDIMTTEDFYKRYEAVK